MPYPLIHTPYRFRAFMLARFPTFLFPLFHSWSIIGDQGMGSLVLLTTFKRGVNMEDTKIALFKGKKIRKTIHNNEWWFVVEDVVSALTDTVNPKDYINKMRRRDLELAKGYGQIVHTPFLRLGYNMAFAVKGVQF
jgi:hypothetical protein